MVADGGVVKSRLILDGSQFSQSWKKEVRDLQNSMGRTDLAGPIKKQMQSVEKTVSDSAKNMGKSIGDGIKTGQKVAGNALTQIELQTKKTATTVQTTFSHLLKTPISGNVFSKLIHDTEKLTGTLYQATVGLRNLESQATKTAQKSASQIDRMAYNFKRLTGVDYRGAAGFQNLMKDLDNADQKALNTNRTLNNLKPFGNYQSEAGMQRLFRDLDNLERKALQTNRVLNNLNASGYGYRSEAGAQNLFRSLDQYERDAISRSKEIARAKAAEAESIRRYGNNVGNLQYRLAEARASTAAYTTALQTNYKAIRANDNLSKNYYNNLTKSFFETRNAVPQIDALSKTLNTAQSSFGNLGNTVPAVSRKIALDYESALKKMENSTGATVRKIAADLSSINKNANYNAMSSNFEANLKKMDNDAKSHSKSILSSLTQSNATDYMAAIAGTYMGSQLWEYGMARGTTQQLLSSKGAAGDTMYKGYVDYTVASSTSDADINRMFQYVMNAPGVNPNLTYRALGAINAAAYSPDPVQRYRDMLAYGRYFQGGWDNAGKALLDEGLTEDQQDRMKAAKTPEQRAAMLEEIAKTRGAMNQYGQDISTLTTGPMSNYNKVLVITDSLMRGMTQGFNIFLGKVSPLMDWFIGLNDETKGLVGQLAFFSGAILIGASALGILLNFLSPVGSGIVNVTKYIWGMTAANRAAAIATGEMTIAQKLAEAASVRIAAAGGGITGAFKAAGSALLGFATTPVGMAIIGLTALIGVLVIAGEKYGWFKGTIESANDALAGMKQKIEDTKKAQSDAKNEVTKWEGEVKKATPGTWQYNRAVSKLAGAKTTLRQATIEATSAEDLYNKKNEAHEGVMQRLADATQRLAEATIRYRVATGELTPEQGAGLRLGAEEAATLSEADRTLLKDIEEKNKVADYYIRESSKLETGQTPKPTAEEAKEKGFVARFFEDTTGSGDGLWKQIEKGIGWTLGSPEALWHTLTGSPMDFLFPGGTPQFPNLISPFTQSFIPGVSAATTTGKGTTGQQVDLSQGTSVQSVTNPNAWQLPDIQLPDIDIPKWISDNIETPVTSWWNSWTFPNIFNPGQIDVGGWINTNIIGPIGQIPGQAGQAISSLPGTVSLHIGNAINTGKTWVGNGVQWIKDKFWSLVGSAGGAWQGVYNAVRPPIDWIGGKIQWLRNLVGGGSAKSTLTSIGSAAGNALNNAIHGAGPAAGPGIFDNTSGITNSIFDGVQNLANGFFGGNAFNVRTMSEGPGAWDAFMNYASNLFSGFDYDFYFDHRQNSLATHTGNCWDLSQALIDIGRVFGFNGSMTHGFWGNVGHMAANFGNRTLDATNWVLHHNWSTPPNFSRGPTGALTGVRAAGPGGSGDTIDKSITFDFSGATFNGDERNIKKMVKEAAEELIVEFLGVDPANGS